MKKSAAFLLLGVGGLIALALYLRWEMARQRELARQEMRREILDAPVTLARELADGARKAAEAAAGLTNPPPARTRETPKPPLNTTNPPAPDLFTGLLDLAARTAQEVDRIGLEITRLTDEQESQVGREIDREILLRTPGVKDPALEMRLEKIARPLLEQRRRKALRYTVRVLDSAEINAYGAAGGHVYFTRAFVEKFPSDAALAVTLGHEIGHVDLRHSVEKIQYQARGTQAAGDLAALGQLAYATLRSAYTRDQEFEADAYGFEACLKAGWAAKDLLQFYRDLQRFEQEAVAQAGGGAGTGQAESGNLAGRLLDYFKTHPSTAERVARLEALAGRLSSHADGR